MKALFLLNACLLASTSVVSLAADSPNRLTLQEKSAGWTMLWDGRSSKGWVSPKTGSFPEKGWEMKDGVLSVKPGGGGGDIITEERFKDFELTLEFRIAEGANSGVKYFVQSSLTGKDHLDSKAMKMTPAIGLEFQLLDDARHPDAKMGRDGNRTIASLYDLIAASPDKTVHPPGEWNTARIVAKGDHVEHWLNGEKVVEYERDSRDFEKLVERSKYKSIAHFGQWSDGHILLQDHGNSASFRNVKIRRLTRGK